VNVVQDGVPLLTRDLFHRHAKFRERLQRERGLPAEDAEQMLQGYERTPSSSRACRIAATRSPSGSSARRPSCRPPRGMRASAGVLLGRRGARSASGRDAERLRIPGDREPATGARGVERARFEGPERRRSGAAAHAVIGLALRREKE